MEADKYLLTSDILDYNLANTTGLSGSAALAAQVQAQISNAITSCVSFFQSLPTYPNHSHVCPVPPRLFLATPFRQLRPSKPARRSSSPVRPCPPFVLPLPRALPNTFSHPKAGNATAAQDCITQGAAPTLSMIAVNGLAEQFQGARPPPLSTPSSH